MQSYGDGSWGQPQSTPYSPAASQHYHSSSVPPSSNSSSSGSSSSRKKDKDKDRSDKSSKRDKGADSSKHSKRNSSGAQHSGSQQASSGNNNSSSSNASNNSNGAFNPPLSSSNYSSPPSPTTPPSPPSPPLPPLRVDLHARHQALNTLLTTTPTPTPASPSSDPTSRLTAYWHTVELFLRAQLSKAELDADVRRLLGTDGVCVHNDFFMALLQNAMSDELPSAAVKAKREGRDGDGGGGSAGKGAEKVKREGAEVGMGKEGQKVDGKEGRKDKEKAKEGKRDKSGTPLPLTPTAASAASAPTVSVKSEDKKDGKSRKKDGAVKGEKDGKRDKRKDRHEEDEAVDWTEQVWPSPPPPQRWSEVSQASVHREMKHITSARDYFAALRRERERRGVGRDGDGEEGGKEGSEWLWAIDESKAGYLRVRSAEEDSDDSRASVQHAVTLIRSRSRSKRGPAEENAAERKAGNDDERADGGEWHGSSGNGSDRPPAWLNPASSAAYRLSSLSLPAMPALRARCLLTAKHNGVKTISESALSLIHQAMSQYVRTLLAEMLADRTELADVPPAPTNAAQQHSTHEQMDVDTATVSTSSASSPPPAEPAASSSSSSSPASVSSFPASCFAPSLFTPLSAPSVETESDLAPAARSTSLVREVSSADAHAAVPADGSAASADPAAAAAVAGESATDASATVKMETDTSAAPAEATTSTGMDVSNSSATSSSPDPTPAAPGRSLSVSVPTSPPSLVPSVASPTAPSWLLADRARAAEADEKAKEAEDDARMSFPFLIARQPACRIQPPSSASPFLPPLGAGAAQPSTAASAARSSAVASAPSPSLTAALSLSDLLECLRDRRSTGMRVADDLPVLLERLIIVQ